MALLPVRADKPMVEARERIDGNFAQTMLYPLATNPNRLRIVGSISSNKQQAYFATDGRDYLSPDTGIMKNAGGDQTINGNLIVQGNIRGNSLTITSGGARIATSFYVYNDAALTSVSFGVDTSKNTICYGTLTSRGIFYANSGMSVAGTIVATSNGHRFGTTTITGLTTNSISNSGNISTNTISTQTLTSATINNSGHLTTNSLQAANTSAFYGRLELFNGGNPGQMYLVRPMYCGSGSVPGNLPIGHLYGQYK